MSHQPNDRLRVVITGMGAITPVGFNTETMWSALQAGKSGANRIFSLDPSAYPCQVGGELVDFNPADHLPHKKLRHMSTASQLAVIAANQAWEDAELELEGEALDQVAVILGTAGGASIEEAEIATRQLVAEAPRKLSPFQILKMWPNMPSYFVAEQYGLRGYNSTVCTACAAATQAIGEAAEWIRRGKSQVVITGGTDRMVSETALAGFTAMRALSTGFNHEPARAMRPFDAARDGFIPAAGSGVLILESLQHATRRGARIHAEIVGFGASNDAYNMIIPDPEGAGAALAIQRALADAGLKPEDIQYINAHGTSTPAGDISETKAIKRALGEAAYDIPVSSTKSMLGHMMGATGAVEAIVCVKTIQDNVIHPTINYDTPDPDCDLDYVPNVSRNADVRYALTNSFGLGGQNACLILAHYPDSNQK